MLAEVRELLDEDGTRRGDLDGVVEAPAQPVHRVAARLEGPVVHHHARQQRVRAALKARRVDECERSRLDPRIGAVSAAVPVLGAVHLEQLLRLVVLLHRLQKHAQIRHFGEGQSCNTSPKSMGQMVGADRTDSTRAKRAGEQEHKPEHRERT